MANQIIVKLMSSLLNGKTYGKSNSFESGKGDGKFFSDLLKDLNASKSAVLHRSGKSAKIQTASNTTGYKYYLESFKKELLAQGKQLNKAFLNEKDLPLIKTFLFKCGFSNEKVEQFIKDLKADNSDGEFNLSQLFFRITELGTPKRKEYRDEAVAPAVVPYIESVLRDFNLSPKELDSVFSKAKNEGGGLDLNILMEKLKEIKSRRSLADNTVVDQKLSRQISDKMEKIGINTPEKGKTDQISLDDFIASLEQISKKVGKNKSVSPEIKNTLGKILEKVEFSEQTSESASAVKVSSNYHFTESLLKEEKSNKSRHRVNGKAISLLDKNKPGKNKSTSSFTKSKDVHVQNYVGSNAGTSNHSEKVDLNSNLDKLTKLINPPKGRGYRVDAEQAQNNISSNTETLNPNMLKTVEQGEQSFRGYLTTSILDQVGKQISRSILRGDRVITLHLRPPDLGAVKIEMEIKDHTLRLGMIAENQSVKELLLNNVHELKGALVQHGVTLEKVEVQINYNFGQSLNASKEGSDGERSWRQDHNGEAFHSDNPSDGIQERPINFISGNKLLDLVA